MESKNAIKMMEEELFNLVRQNTPEKVKAGSFINLNNKGRFEFLLTKEIIQEYGVLDWFANYRKEALVSTGGIRGPQNILYPWDTRFPINHMGIMLATLGKALVLKDKYGTGKIDKLAGCEVRYNSKTYVELISRIQAGVGITTHVTPQRTTIPIWLASFLVFKYDFAGGEYVTSSHSVSTKIATKDLNNEGSQFMPEESAGFVAKIEMILRSAEISPYKITLEAANSRLIDEDFMKKIGNGIPLYVEYLRKGVATQENLALINGQNKKLVVDCVGGCMYQTQSKIFDELKISSAFDWLHTEEDPFFHGIGKVLKNPRTGKDEYFDFSVDTSIIEVVRTMNYEESLKDRPLGTVVEAVDPDGDRLELFQIEPMSRKAKLDSLGIETIEIGDRLLTAYAPNQSYLMIMDFHLRQLRRSGIADRHPYFVIKTTASAMSWDEWCAVQGIPVVNLPVGFKEIASMMKKIERQIAENPDKEVVVKDIFGKHINLGVQPRLLFAGEESGGMITGPEDMIISQAGRLAIAMREKSDGEALILASAMATDCEKRGVYLSEFIEEIFLKCDIKGRYDIRIENVFYNESNPDPVGMKLEKQAGEVLRDRNDNFFLGLAMARREAMITISEARQILMEAMPTLHFDNLLEISFVGDGTYMLFTDKYVEIRKSGTDAKTKGYGAGNVKKACIEYAKQFAYYSGALTPTYKRIIGEQYLKDAPQRAKRIYLDYLQEGAPNAQQ